MVLFLQERVGESFADFFIRNQNTSLTVFRLRSPMNPYPRPSRYLYQHRHQLSEFRTHRHLHFVYQRRNKAVRILQCRCYLCQVLFVDTCTPAKTVFHRIDHSSNCLSGDIFTNKFVVHIFFLSCFNWGPHRNQHSVSYGESVEQSGASSSYEVASHVSFSLSECKYMSFFRLFVGAFHQSLLRRVLFCQNLTYLLVAHPEILAQCHIQFHCRHRSVHVCGSLPDTFMTLLGCLSHRVLSLIQTFLPSLQTEP